MYGAADLPAVRNHLQDLRREGVPVVVHADGLDLDGLDTVSADHEEGARQLTGWLLDHGCRQILRLWDRDPAEPPPTWLRLRNAGYVKAHVERGLEPLPAAHVVVPANGPAQQRPTMVREALRSWLGGSTRIDAVMTLTDGFAMNHLVALRDLGLRPNIDVAVVGYDDYWPDLPDLTPCPPLATINKQNLLTGRTLVEVLSERQAGPDHHEPIHRLVPPRLVVEPEQAARWIAARGRR